MAEPFVLVSRKRHRRRRVDQQRGSQAGKREDFTIQEPRMSEEKLLSFVRKGEGVQELASRAEEALRQLLSHRHLDCLSIQEIVVYGIGSFTTCRMSRSQLALICALRQRIGGSGVRVVAFDPILEAGEYSLLQRELDIDPIPRDEACKRSIQRSPGVVLFFMPHLDKGLYDNLLSVNWTKGQLERLVILGNSFSHMIDSWPTRVSRLECPFVLECVRLRLLREHSLPSIDDSDDCFNDLSVQGFTSDHVSAEQLESARRSCEEGGRDADAGAAAPAPRYAACDERCLRRCRCSRRQ